MFKKYSALTEGIVLIALLATACQKWDDYKKYQSDGEKVYPGIFSNAKAFAGKYRVLLTWAPAIDQAVARYVVYWNNKADSMEAPATSHRTNDTVKIYINGLKELTYSFQVYSYNGKGNQSAPVEINNIKVYGDVYNSGLLNRVYKRYNYSNNVLALVWGAPDTINIRTEVQYTNINGALKTAWLLPNKDTLFINDWKGFGSMLYYRSAYVPVRTALDTFFVGHFDSLKLNP